MKVVYDVSVLGQSAIDPKARTGVFRVVENVALGLAGSPECEVEFVAGGESFHAVYGAYRYLAGQTPLRSVPFRSGRRGTWLRRRALDVCAAGLGAGGAGPLARATRRLSGAGCELLARVACPVDAAQLRGAQIYHSPHAPLPDSARGPQRFLTVYDLIAVMRPDLFEPHVAPYVRRILASIGPGDWVTCISEATKRDLCEHIGLDPARVFVTPLAASRELFHPVGDIDALAAIRARYGIPEGPYLLGLNTLEPRKNLTTAVRAFARVVEETGADLSLVLVGGRGWKYEGVFEAVERSGAARDRVIFAGYVADEDLAALYSGALAFVYPSLYEGFGLPVLEAMQCGVPVVASSSSSLPEVVGGAGRLVDPLDVDGFAAVLAELYADAAVRADLGRRALERAAQFSWERTTRETLAAYRIAIDA